MRIAERLEAWDGKDIGFLGEVFELHGHRADFVADVDAALRGSALSQSGGTWLLKRFLEEGGRLEPADVERLLGSLQHLDPWEARLHGLQCLPHVPIPGRCRAAVERFVRACLESEVKFVRAWAFTGLHQLAKAFEDLRPEAEAAFERALEEGPASVRARVRNILREGY